MDEKLLAAFVGVVTGAVGYWVANFWMQPILNYRALRARVHADFIFYGQVVNAEGLNERLQEMYKQRIAANRRNSADLAACISDLPAWYRLLIRIKGQNPERAVANLIGFSNTTEFEAAARHAAAVRNSLDIPPES